MFFLNNVHNLIAVDTASDAAAAPRSIAICDPTRKLSRRP
jgi:hypothetical protein